MSAAPPVVPPVPPLAETEDPPAGPSLPEPADDSSAVVDAAPRSGRALLPLGALALAVLLVLAGTIFFALQVRAESATEQARTEALSASRDAARALFSYNHETLDEDFSRGLALTTGDFREEYSGTTEDVVRDVATQYKAVVQATVSEAGVISASPDEVVTLVFLNQVTTSTRVEGQKIDQSRVRMRLVDRDGRWLVAQVDAI